MTRKLNVEFGAVTNDNVEQLRKVNTVSFPVTYNEAFYQDVVKRSNENLNKFAYFNGFVVGAVCTRIEAIPSKDGIGSTDGATASSTPQQAGNRLYIMTLAVLAAYRGRGIGTQLIQSVLDYCTAEKGKDDTVGRIDEICLHVQTSNSDAIRFYTHRFGFVQGEMVENYYRRIHPPHCYRLYKVLHDKNDTTDGEQQ